MYLPLCFSLLVSIICVIFVVKKLKLNAYIKTILLVMNFVNISASTVSLWMIQSCKIVVTGSMFTFGNFPMGSFVSILRYHLAYSASKAKVPNKTKTLFFIWIGTLISYLPFPVGVNLSDFLGYASFLGPCGQNLDLPSKSIIPIVGVSIVWILLGIGLVFDVKMYRFVKKRQTAVQPGISLIPWKSTNHSTKEDLQVPIKATTISTIFLILVMAFSTIIPIFVNGMDEELMPGIMWWVSRILHFVTPFYPVLLIIFSVKDQSKIKKTQPPSGLQFHEEQNQQNEMNENAACEVVVQPNRLD